ncbi:tryptophan halogenase family protein [Gayadomonas joobiniege]|uniref:tryptophan halogenase family protein n=1 Tax=Gayadomonas joobiniege TaxID=1234606 RepID=UPI000378EFCE|nr:tryptophan halogenase family protein [Gayadomonas joobiniege]
MAKPIQKVVILGGGAAGWLTAGTLAAEHLSAQPDGLEVVLVESPDVKILGVGEGTWPTMRATLNKMGIKEADFIRECDAAFKQGAKFCQWTHNDKQDFYYHPLVLPHNFNQINLAQYWSNEYELSFADAVCPQSQLCEQGLAPKQISTPEYAHVANYAYHLDAGKFTQFLKKHCLERLGVQYIQDHIDSVQGDPNSDIKGLVGRKSGLISGDLFIDCSGFAARLIADHYQVAHISQKNVLFNDTAIAAHVKYPQPDSPIASHTVSTATANGWIWDIGLQSRRGVGHVFASDYVSHAEAEQQLIDYITATSEMNADEISCKTLNLNPGYREKFWVKNCVAIGVSAGFIEPLEASALVLVELSAAMLSENLPADRAVMEIAAKRFNETFNYRWQRIIDFLKLHYCISQRDDSNYWRDHRDPASWPESLSELLAMWQYQGPWKKDFTHIEEVFPSASYQYVLYGMGYQHKTHSRASRTRQQLHLAQAGFAQNQQITEKMLAHLPAHRRLINHIIQA